MVARYILMSKQTPKHMVLRKKKIITSNIKTKSRVLPNSQLSQQAWNRQKQLILQGWSTGEHKEVKPVLVPPQHSKARVSPGRAQAGPPHTGWPPRELCSSTCPRAVSRCAGFPEPDTALQKAVTTRPYTSSSSKFTHEHHFNCCLDQHLSSLSPALSPQSKLKSWSLSCVCPTTI